MAIIRLDEDECWVLHEWVRRERSAPAYGEEHDLGFMTDRKSTRLNSSH